MSTTNIDSLVRVGMNAEQAKLVGALIDAPGTAAANAQKLIGFGFTAPLATELGTQMNGGTGDVAKLAALGVPHALATLLKTLIDAP